ncbi:hypothetical protein [Sporofaciens sp. SGI.106]|uniref:hypothetical protein n=1 Tax=Sporofaciens sp. SGI.106 TaxID=3420568 RepID=UPI003D00557B
MIDTSKSNSAEQQEAENFIANAVEEWLGCLFERNTKVYLSDGVHIEPDMYSEKDKIICEIYAHIGKLKVGQQHKISQDILKMLLLEKSKGVQFRKIIVVADERVEKYLKGESFIAESIRQFDVEIKRIPLAREIHDSVSKAQMRQVMINSNFIE